MAFYVSLQASHKRGEEAEASSRDGLSDGGFLP